MASPFTTAGHRLWRRSTGRGSKSGRGMGASASLTRCMPASVQASVHDKRHAHWRTADLTRPAGARKRAECSASACIRIYACMLARAGGSGSSWPVLVSAPCLPHTKAERPEDERGGCSAGLLHASARRSLLLLAGWETGGWRWELELDRGAHVRTATWEAQACSQSVITERMLCIWSAKQPDGKACGAPSGSDLIWLAASLTHHHGRERTRGNAVTRQWGRQAGNRQRGPPSSQPSLSPDTRTETPSLLASLRDGRGQNMCSVCDCEWVGGVTSEWCVLLRGLPRIVMRLFSHFLPLLVSIS